MEYLLLKYLHIISSIVLFGTGLGSAFYKWRADGCGDVAAIVHTNRQVVLADWLFTTPTVIIQPLSGLWLVHILGYSLLDDWLLWALVLYALAGACWLPVVWLQIRMRNLADEAQAHGSKLDEGYWRLARIWFWLGVPAFLAMLSVVFLMTFKPR